MGYMNKIMLGRQPKNKNERVMEITHYKSKSRLGSNPRAEMQTK